MSWLLQDYSIEQKRAGFIASRGFMERWKEATTMFVPLHIKALSNANYSLALLAKYYREPGNEKKKKHKGNPSDYLGLFPRRLFLLLKTLLSCQSQPRPFNVVMSKLLGVC